MLSYDGQKKQIQKMVRRMNKKRTLEIFIQRSQGSLLQQQIKFQQATEIKALQELKLNNLQSHKNKRKTFCFSNTTNQIRNFKRHNTQLNNHKQHSMPGIDKDKQNLNQNQTQKVNKQNYKEHLNFNSNLLSPGFIQNVPQKKVRKFSTRPALQELQQYLNQKDTLILERRKRIIQMLILCLMRRCHKKPWQALDVALQAYTFFFDIDRQNYLKTICLKLIGKIYNEISCMNQKKKKKNIESKVEAKAAQRFARKRHSSIMIKTLASQRVFFTRFAKKYSQSNLLIETNFQNQLKRMKLTINRNQNQNLTIKQSLINQPKSCLENKHMKRKNVLIKINQDFAVSLPPPQKLYPSQNDENPRNYNLVIHQRDKQSASKLFPYEYPSSLQKIISKKEYIFLLSSINGLIFSETRCYNFMQVLKKTISYFIVLTSLILGVTLSVTNNEPLNWFILVGCLLSFILVSYLLVVMNTKCVYGSGQANEKVFLQLQKWNKKYIEQKVIFRISFNLQALIISWPRNQMQESDQDSQIDSINQSSLSVDSDSRHTLFQKHLQTYQIFNQNQTEKDVQLNINEVKQQDLTIKTSIKLKSITDIIIDQDGSNNSQRQNKSTVKQIQQSHQTICQNQQFVYYPQQNYTCQQNIDSIQNPTQQQQKSKNQQNTQKLNRKKIAQDQLQQQNIFTFQYFLDQQQHQESKTQIINVQNIHEIINTPSQFNIDKTQHHHVDQNQNNNNNLSSDTFKKFQYEEIDLQSQPQDHVIDNI